MGIGYRIKEARENQGYTQTELGKLVGVTGSAITNYENETSHPKEPVMYKLIEALKVDANYLFQDCVKLSKEINDITLSEYNHIKKYRELDSHGKKMIDFTLNEEWKRSQELKADKNMFVSVKTKEEMLEDLRPVAAHNDNASEEQLAKMQEDIENLKIPE